MGKSLVLGALLGGIVAFGWSAVSWMLLPWHESTFLPFQNEDLVSQVIVSSAPQSGMYVLPGGGLRQTGKSPEEKRAAEAAAWEKMKRGPLVLAAVTRQGMASETKPMILGFMTQVIAALLLTWLLLLARSPTYGARVGLVVLAALAGGVISHVPNWIWWGFSTDYTAVALADVVIGWFLAGLIIAKVAAPKTTWRTAPSPQAVAG